MESLASQLLDSAYIINMRHCPLHQNQKEIKVNTALLIAALSVDSLRAQEVKLPEVSFQRPNMNRISNLHKPKDVVPELVVSTYAPKTELKPVVFETVIGLGFWNEKFLVFWIGGEIEEMEGNTISEAFNSSGYGAGAMSAVDFYSEGTKDQYIPVLNPNGKYHWLTKEFCEMYPTSFERINSPVTEKKFISEYYYKEL